MPPNELRILEIRLGEQLVGHLGTADGTSIWVPTDTYVADTRRPTLSLSFVGQKLWSFRA